MIHEGSAFIEAAPEENQDEKGGAFYNKVQVVNRDLSILVVQTYIRTISSCRDASSTKHEIHVLEALGATGLRSVRYFHEISGITRIICNDMSPSAVALMKKNFLQNNIPEKSIIANCDDANTLMRRLSRSIRDPVIAHLNPASEDMLQSGKPGTYSIPLQAQKMHVVDIDPYGSASPFLSSAIACTAEGGLLCVTCTDSAVLCGKYPETCHSKYGSLSLKNCSFNHEMGLRILLAAIERAANLQGRYCRPLLSAKIDFYFRVFVQLFTKPIQVKRSCTKMSYILQCSQCSHFQLLPVALAQKHKGLHTKDASASECHQPPVGTNGEEYLCSPDMPSSPNFAVSTPRLSRNSIFGWQKVTDNFTRENDDEIDQNKWCPSCSSCSYTLGGPIYNQSINDVDFIKSCSETLKNVENTETSEKKMVLGARDRVDALLINLMQELTDVPLYHSIPRMCSDLRYSVPPFGKLIDAIHRLGFQCSRSHCNIDAIKTNTPSPVLYAILRSFFEPHESVEDRSCCSYGKLTSGKLPHIQVSQLRKNIWEVNQSSACHNEAPKKHVRYLPNPEPNWGPKARTKM
ncbi:N(2)N(2)-dimethylguanosine tRNA methyltransferase [Perkinsela sp. CCAP 1560/4]|nr:N(2)N(2)-dimethylguanosine tRNA methyltransferase [Perkinsela sp. CCAP 1560/4]|eukprot:KNH07714.1 N(2)N(2)-dimethylguanosine tRNA methyltransferase [Perkinsela sp. CCAP 1560/4]